MSENTLSKNAVPKNAVSGKAVPDNALSDDTKGASLWQRHRMPIILGIVAVCLYLGSIVWMVYTGSQAG